MKDSAIEKAKFKRENRKKVNRLIHKHANNQLLNEDDFKNVVFNQSVLEQFQSNAFDVGKVFDFLYTYMFKYKYIPITKKTFKMVKTWYIIYTLGNKPKVIDYNPGLPYKEIHNSFSFNNNDWLESILKNFIITPEQELLLMKKSYKEILKYDEYMINNLYRLINDENKEWFETCILTPKILMQ